MFSGHVPERRCARIGPRQQFVDLAVWMAVHDLRHDVGEIVVRFDIAQLAGFDQRSNHGPVLTAAI